ncbi:hypothetical protein D1115_19250 [Vibrio alfacsensis]|uniref:Uncharacterized protein n=1 Tax=Vibrio alfacsensis TaxID=1074311 RepID=A0ABM6YZ47_9VIBR|nr:hypothetical protein [Vibrio alfacsensis]AXY03066.1 hypothetical protein D1115_19250 [Vibrio alfacsensis]
MAIAKFLSNVGIVRPAVNCEESLIAGFCLGYASYFRDKPLDLLNDSNGVPEEFEDFHKEGLTYIYDSQRVNSEKYEQYVNTVLTYVDKLEVMNPKPSLDFDFLNRISKRLVENRLEEQNLWFRLGFTFYYNLLWGWELIALSPEERSAIFEREDSKKLLSQLYNVLEDLRWSPDNVELFVCEKLLPFLDEQGIRKWVFDQNMALMGDLKYQAREVDYRNEPPSTESKICESLKKVIEQIPVIGPIIVIWLCRNK